MEKADNSVFEGGETGNMLNQIAISPQFENEIKDMRIPQFFIDYGTDILGGQYDLLENEFADCWEKLRNDSEQIRLPAECSACEAKVICHTCAAMVYTETGSFETKPEYRCDLLRAIPKACKRVLEESVLNEDLV